MCYVELASIIEHKSCFSVCYQIRSQAHNIQIQMSKFLLCWITTILPYPIYKSPCQKNNNRFCQYVYELQIQYAHNGTSLIFASCLSKLRLFSNHTNFFTCANQQLHDTSHTCTEKPQKNCLVCAKFIKVLQICCGSTKRKQKYCHLYLFVSNSINLNSSLPLQVCILMFDEQI